MTARTLAGLGVCALLALGGACSRSVPPSPDAAQAIVVGAGLAGLSAAVEMGRRGVDVLVVDQNSVAGGHTVLAGGVALVQTPVQEAAGIEDSPGQAYRDWMSWTEDGDAEWTRYYAEHSREMIYDWVTEMGVEFVRVAPGHGNSVPRFHFTSGRAVNLVLPIYRTALGLPSVRFLFNHRVDRLLRDGDRVTGIVATDLRDGAQSSLRAVNVVLATGGFENDTDRVLANWMPDLARPDRLLSGAAPSATGTGHDMAMAAGARLDRIDRHYIYVNGLPDPRDHEHRHALTAGNESSLWVNAQGRRFTNEAGYDKDILVDILRQTPNSYWVIFDSAARDDFGARGAAWLNNAGQGHPLLDDPATVLRAQTLGDLAALAELPEAALRDSVDRYNAMIDAGADSDFGRFASADDAPPKISVPPYYAVQLFLMTRKTMGGVAVDREMRAVDGGGRVVPGLYAVGELNGSLGINGRHGLDGTFLGPAILSGRLAGQSIAATYPDTASVAEQAAPVTDGRDDADRRLTLTAADLDRLLAVHRDGYWHFEVSHALVRERRYSCTACHSSRLPFAPVTDNAGRLAQTVVCTTCH